MSQVVKQIAGTYVEDDHSQRPPVAAWLQRELRTGSLRMVVENFAKKQPEILDMGLLLVEEVTGQKITCRIPCRLFDHESTGTFQSEVVFEVDPFAWTAIRLR